MNEKPKSSHNPDSLIWKYDERTHFKVHEILVFCCGAVAAAVGGDKHSEFSQKFVIITKSIELEDQMKKLCTSSKAQTSSLTSLFVVKVW